EAFLRSAQETLEDIHQLVDLSLPVARPYRLGDAVGRMAAQQAHAHPVQRRPDRGDLDQDVDAVAALLDHAGDAPHLSLDAAHALEQARPFVQVGRRVPGLARRVAGLEQWQATSLMRRPVTGLLGLRVTALVGMWVTGAGPGDLGHSQPSLARLGPGWTAAGPSAQDIPIPRMGICPEPMPDQRPCQDG